MNLKNTKLKTLFFLRKTIFVSGGLAAALVLQSCSSQKDNAAFTADPAAFEYAVQKTAEMQIYMHECPKAGSEMQKTADEASAAWYQRNWPQSHAADVGYSEKLESQTISYNNEKIALPAIKLYASLEKNIQLKLDQTRHAHSNIVDVCMKKLAAYKDGSQDLSQNKNADLYLKSLAAGANVPVYKVPSLTGTLKPSSMPGRSQFNLEKSLIEWDCANAEVMTLRNEWPYEVYGAFCPNGKAVFVSCEWGVCKSQ